jgi:hypothetical protein
LLLALMLDNLWVLLGVWILLYISDYALTLVGARWRAKRMTAVSTQGSYELNAYFQKDIDSQRVISPRFILALVWSTFLLGCMWLLARLDPIGMDILETAIGALILLELAIHIRHLRNLFSFRRRDVPGEASGNIVFSRRYIYWVSSLDLFLYALLYFILFVFVGHLFFIGGVIGCLAAAARHRLSMRRAPLLEPTT